MEYREVLAQYLKEKNISEAELARRIGSPRSTVNAIMIGRAKAVAALVVSGVLPMGLAAVLAVLPPWVTGAFCLGAFCWAGKEINSQIDRSFN